MGSARILVVIGVLAVGAAAWLVTRGDGERRGAGADERTSASRATASDGVDAAVLRPASSPDEPALSEHASPGREPAAVAPANPSGAPPEPMATLALRLVARETHQPIPGVHAQLVGPPRGDRKLSGAGPFFEPGDAWSWTDAPVVFVQESRGTELYSPESDADGRLEIEARAGHRLSLHINPGDRAHVRADTYDVLDLEPGERRESEIALVTRDDLRWYGRVLDDETGAPLAGASAAWVGMFGKTRPASVVSAADGMLALDFASWQQARIAIELSGYLTQRLDLERGFDGPDRACPVRLVRPASLQVRVRDGVGAPLAGLQVELVQLEAERDAALGKGGGTVVAPTPSFLASIGGPVEPRRIAPATTDADGTCTFEDLPPREELSIALRAGLGRTQRENLTLQPGETRTLDFTVGDGCRLDGLAVDERGEPLTGLDLWRLVPGDPPLLIESTREGAVVDKVRTDARGRFTFANVPAGDWWIGPAPYHRNRGIVPLATPVTIGPGERVRALTLTCSLAHFIEGRVWSAAGEPASAFVRAEQGEARQFVQTGSDGRFRLGPVSVGEWLVSASSVVGSSDARSESVRAPQDATDVELRLRAGGRLSGRVLDERGAGIPEAEVQLLGGTGVGAGVVDSMLTSVRGSFAFPGSLPGTYTLLARSGAWAGALGPLTLAAGERVESLEVRLSAGAELSLRFAKETPDGLVARVAWNGVGVATLPARGEPSLVLPAGSVVVQLAQAGGPRVLEEVRVDLARGETRRLELGGQKSR